jgi:hypothetical protein
MQALACGVLVASASAAQAAAPKGAPYSVKGAYYETCACSVSCPCATGKFKPTEPHCDAAMVFHFDKGNVGKVKLDGLNMVGVLRSPKDKIVKQAFADGAVDLLAFYVDDKATPEQREAIGQVFPALFGEKPIGGFKAPQFVPMTFTVEGDIAKLNAMGGKITFETENLAIPEVGKLDPKAAAKAKPKRITITNSGPFPWIGDMTQGQSKSFHYDDNGAKWDYKDRNAFFGTFASKGTTPPPAAAPAPAK